MNLLENVENVLSYKSTCMLISLTCTSDMTVHFFFINQLTGFTTLTVQETKAECEAAGDGVKQ